MGIVSKGYAGGQNAFLAELLARAYNEASGPTRRCRPEGTMRRGFVEWARRLVGRGELDCGDIEANCSDYVDDELSATVAQKFRSHMDSCTDCNTLVATFRATVLTLRDLPRRTPSSDLRAKIRSRIAEEPSNASGPT